MNIKQNMRMVEFKNGAHEWQWNQKYKCGCFKPNACLGGKRPFLEVKRLKNKICPTCELERLMREP